MNGRPGHAGIYRDVRPGARAPVDGYLLQPLAEAFLYRSPEDPAPGTWRRRLPADGGSAMSGVDRFRWPLRVRVASLLVLLMLPVAGLAATGDTAGGLQLRTLDGRLLGHAPRLDTEAGIDVSGLIARARVRQTFRNPTDDWLEGVYVFPLPEDAAVDHLQMRYAGRRIDGEIRERNAARRAYRAARATGQGASLVEQQRANVFTVAVANIPPRETVEVDIEYQQLLHWRDAAFALRLPLVVGPRYIPGRPQDDVMPGDPGHGWAPATDQVPDAPAITPPVIAGDGAGLNPVRIEVRLDAGIELAAIESPHHRVRSVSDGPGRYRIALADGTVAADRDFVLRWRPAVGSAPAAALFRERWHDRDYGLLLLMPPAAGAAVPVPARELVLVVDTSGSMHGDSIEQARAALLDALRALRPRDCFNVIQFNSETRSLFESARPADAAHLHVARRYVEGLRADGGTEMLPALHRALAGPTSPGYVRQVVFLTDGAVGNEAALFEAVAAGIGDSRLFTVGIGSAPNGLFMRRAATLGRGTFTYIGSSADVRREVGGLFRRLRAPVLTDLRLTWPVQDGAEVPVQAPAVVPDLYAGEPLAIALAASRLPAAVRVEGRLGAETWWREVSLNGGAVARGVHALWARRKIDDWLQRSVTGTPADEVRQAVIDLALHHHLVSRYTSLVAVDRTPARPVDAAPKTSAVPVHLPAGWSAESVFGRMPGTATPWLLHVVAGLFAVGIGLRLRR